MSELVCHCGHARRDHLKAGCRMTTDGLEDPFVQSGVPWTSCECKAFDNSVLPDDGERLEFGKHRVRADVAETAPAWPPLK